MGEWDNLTKMLVRAHPQDLVSLVLQNTHYLADITNELKVRSVSADFLCKAERDDEEIIVHVEFQKRKDTNMGLRTWEYNCATTYLEKLPVCSFVIYLVKQEPIAEPPFRITLKDGKVIHTFQYTNIFLWELPSDALMQKGMEGMLPLLPLTKGAELARDKIVDDMITGIRKAGKDDVLSLGYAFASLVYRTEDDKHALKRRFTMFQGALEDSWFYKEVIEKGLQEGMQKGIEQGMQKGIEQGMQKGIEQGEMRTLRSVLTRVVETRFPELLSLAQEEAKRSTDPAILNTKVDKLLVVETLEEARQVLQER